MPTPKVDIPDGRLYQLICCLVNRLGHDVTGSIAAKETGTRRSWMTVAGDALGGHSVEHLTMAGGAPVNGV